MQRAEGLRGENARGRLPAPQAQETERLFQRLVHQRRAFFPQRLLDHGDGPRITAVGQPHRRARADGGIRIGELRARLVRLEKGLDGDAKPPVGRDFG